MVALREYLRDGDPFSVEALKGDEVPPYTHVVSYDDVAASDFEQQVASSTDALEAVEGVQEVEHADREVIYLLAPGVKVTALNKALKTHWRDAAKAAPKAPSRLEAPAALIDEVLLPAGFVRRGAVWNRRLEDGFRQYVDVAQNMGGGDLFMTFGFHIPALMQEHDKSPRWVTWSSGHLKQISRTWEDLKAGLDPYGGSGKHSGRGEWPYPDGAADIANWVRDTLLPHLDERNSVARLLELHDPKTEAPLWIEARLKILMSLDRHAQASQVFHEHAMTAGFPDEVDYSQRMASEFGLPKPPVPSKVRQLRNRRMKNRPWSDRSLRR